MAVPPDLWENCSYPAEPILVKQIKVEMTALLVLLTAFILLVVSFFSDTPKILFFVLGASFIGGIFIVFVLFEKMASFVSETWPESVPPGHVALISQRGDGSYIGKYATSGTLVLPWGYSYHLISVRPVSNKYDAIEIQSSDSYKLIVDISFAYHVDDPILYHSAWLNEDAIKANAISAVSAVASECEALRFVALRNLMCGSASDSLGLRLKGFGCAVDYIDVNPIEFPTQLNAELRAFAVMKKQYPNIEEGLHVDLILAKTGALKKETISGSQERILNIPGFAETLSAALQRVA